LTILLGVFAGLALASKHTAVFTVAAVFGACLLWVLFEPRRRKGRENVGTRYIVSAVVQLVCVGVIAVLVFYILNPAWWGDPLARAGQVLERRQELLTEQVTIFGGYNSMGGALAGFWRQVFVGQPQYYEVAGWENYIGDQIARYEASPWRGITIGGSTVGGLILLVLVGFAIWALLRSKVIAASTRWLIGVWTLVMFATTALLTPLEWQRYYLPLYPVLGLLAALGVWWVAQTIRQLWSSRG
jgi:hypothetical protein